jgi:ADP-ribose pyrophosphatase YjhB (NUDIX family)
MIVFINDIPVRILEEGEEPDAGSVNHVIDGVGEPITQAKLLNHVWVKNVGDRELDHILNLLDAKVPTSLRSLYVSVWNYDAAKQLLRQRFKVVKAAGGLVRKKDKFLMIYRMKKWDLPKGKKERGEKFRQTAVREVGEECNVTVKLVKKICTTWHTYTMNNRAIIKKTKWYVMDVVDDARMRPAVTEDIEETRWMNRKEVYHALEHSYKSISHVFEQYYDNAEVRSSK